MVSADRMVPEDTFSLMQTTVKRFFRQPIVRKAAESPSYFTVASQNSWHGSSEIMHAPRLFTRTSASNQWRCQWIVEVPQWCRSRRIRWCARKERGRKKERRKRREVDDEEAETATSKSLYAFGARLFHWLERYSFLVPIPTTIGSPSWLGRMPRKFLEALACARNGF